LENLHNLTNLILRGNQISEFKNLSHLAHLSELDISENNIPEDSIPNIFDHYGGVDITKWRNYCEKI